MNDFGDLLGTPYAPVSKIAPVVPKLHISCVIVNAEVAGWIRLHLKINTVEFPNSKQWIVKNHSIPTNSGDIDHFIT